MTEESELYRNLPVKSPESSCPQEVWDQHRENVRVLKDITPPRWYGYATEPGWAPLIAELHSRLQEIIPGYELHQCKQKFGSLRYYIDYDKSFLSEKEKDILWKKVSAVVNHYENMSTTICEYCGAPGKMDGLDDGFYFIETLCSEHRTGESRGNHREAMRNARLSEEEREYILSLKKAKEQEKAITERRNELNYEKDFIAAGESYSEADENGNVIIHPVKE